MKGHAPITLRESQPASRKATGHAGPPRQAFENAGWKRQVATIERFSDQDTESTRRHEPGGQPWEAALLHAITDCMTINQEAPSIPQMQSVAKSTCSTVAAAPFHMGTW